jgi:hypothetical protein
MIFTSIKKSLKKIILKSKMIGKKAKIKNVRPAQISIKWGNTNEILEVTFYKSGQDIMDIKRC